MHFCPPYFQSVIQTKLSVSLKHCRIAGSPVTDVNFKNNLRSLPITNNANYGLKYQLKLVLDIKIALKLSEN